MSKAQPNLSNKAADIARYVRHIGAMSYVGRVFIVGSRSPLSGKEPHDGSDWDIMPERIGAGHITRPRRSPFFIHADLFPFRERLDMVEVYPNDVMGVFDG